VTVTSIDKDPTKHTMTVTAHFDAPVARVWQLWADPRKLERWWGPPTYPATFVDHDLTPGGRVTYFMTGPEGDRHHGWWRVESVDPPHRLDVLDGFADEHGAVNEALPTTRMRVSLHAESATRTRVEIESTFPSAEAMEQVLAMGMEEGLRAAMGQMDDVLAAA
jgi:uncharacterized protein YndB with AHSA1/START domain